MEINSWSDILHSLDSLRDGSTDQATFLHLYQKLTRGRLSLPPEFSFRDAQKILYYLLVHENDIGLFYRNVHSFGENLEYKEDLKSRAACGITIDVPNEINVQPVKATKSIISIRSKEDLSPIKKPRKKESLSSVVKKLSIGKIEFQSQNLDQSEETGYKTPDQLESPSKRPMKKRSDSGASPRTPSELENSRNRTNSIGNKIKSVTLLNSGKRKHRTSSGELLPEPEILSTGEISEIGSSDTENLNTVKKKFRHNLVELGKSVQGRCRSCNEEVPHPKQKTLFCTVCSIIVHASCIDTDYIPCNEDQTKHMSNLPKHKRIKRQEPVNPKRPPIGHIHVTLVEARDLAKADFGGKSDPYAVVTSNVSSERFKTKWIRQTLFPVWNESFHFGIHAAEGELTITVWDFDFGKSDDFLGMFNLSIPQIISKSEDGPIDDWYPFQVERKKSKKKPRGTVHLQISYEPASTDIKQPRSKVGSFFDTPEKNSGTEAKILVHEEIPEIISNVVSEGVEEGVRQNVILKTEIVIEEEKRYELGKIIPLSEFEQIYTLGDTLGQGATSIVRLGTKTNTEEKVAVKIINKNDEMWDTAMVSEFRREVLIMSLLSHRHITHWEDILETEDFIFIVLEFVDGGDLLGAILDTEEGYFPEERAARASKQILSGLQYIHKKNIVHRDIKPENILVTQKGFYKISDFGESALLTPESPLLNEYRGTQLYMAPEVLRGQEYGVAVDMWAMGCVSYCMLCGYSPFENPDDETLAFTIINILEHKLEFPEQEWSEVSSEAVKFVKSLLNPEVDARVTAKQAIKHPWLLKLAGGKKKNKE